MPNARVLWMVLAVFLAGCRDTPTATELPAEPGRFHATLSGAFSAEAGGAARIWTESGFGGPEVVLHTEDDSYTISFTPPILGNSGFDFRVGTHRVGALLGGGGLDATMTASAAGEDFFIATAGEPTPD